MTRKYPCLLFLSLVFLISCKKEISNENSTGSGVTVNPKDSLLVRIVERGGGDSIVTSYGYDNSRRLISADYVQTISSNVYRAHFDLIRNATGIITKDIAKSDSLKSIGIDSIVYNVTYNTSTGQYISQLGSANRNGQQVYDSVSYTYSGSKIVQSEDFVNAGFGYIGFVKRIFGYDGTGNITDLKTYVIDFNSLTYQFANETTYQYDLNVNPIKLGFESFLINDPTTLSNYNLVNSGITDEIDPTNSYAYSIVYAYNSLKKPSTGIKTASNAQGASSSLTYYYQ